MPRPQSKKSQEASEHFRRLTLCLDHLKKGDSIDTIRKTLHGATNQQLSNVEINTYIKDARSILRQLYLKDAPNSTWDLAGMFYSIFCEAKKQNNIRCQLLALREFRETFAESTHQDIEPNSMILKMIQFIENHRGEIAATNIQAAIQVLQEKQTKKALTAKQMAKVMVLENEIVED